MVQVRGLVRLSCIIRDRKSDVSFYIVDGADKPILGLKACLDFNLIKHISSLTKTNLKSKNDIVLEYNGVFNNLGCFPGKPCKLILDDKAIPVIHSSRTIPQKLMPKLKESLDNLEQNGVICRQIEPTDWVNNIVITEKKDKNLRICLDPSDLNKCLKREHYQIPSPDQILASLNNKKYFSVLDLRDSFYQIPLDEESSKLCTFATPYGRYRFLRLPFGINTSAEIFQRKNVEIFGNVLDDGIYIDDLIISGSTEEEHDEKLQKVLEIAKKYGITFNKDKFQYKKLELKILGFIISEKGIKVDPQRTEAIEKMKIPTNKKELLRFLGIIKYLGKFCPNLSAVSAPLRQLTFENVLFQWEPTHTETVNKIKNLIIQAPTLAHFDVNKEVIIQCDASMDGFGACLMQDGKPVAFASRTLSDTEKRYANIERELSSIVFAVEKFNYFVYGRQVRIHTDQKPLVNIFRKDINKVSSRLQRLLYRLMKYDSKVEYLPGKQMFIADALSRASLVDPTFRDHEEIHVHSLKELLPISDKKLSELTLSTNNDETLVKLKQCLRNGWKNYRKLPDELRIYQSIRDQISECEDLLFYGDRFIIPKCMRTEMLRKLHEGHLGINKCRARARECLFWPGMSKEIQEYILKCETCKYFQNKNAKQPLLPHELPNRPWDKIGIDIFDFKNKSYLAIIDYYSKWIDFKFIKSKNIRDVINCLMEVFAIFGFPNKIMSDNNPFNSFIFKKFAEDYNVRLIFASPHYPRSNGMAEKAVNICKGILNKSSADNGNISLYLLKYRNTPIPDLDENNRLFRRNREHFIYRNISSDSDSDGNKSDYNNYANNDCDKVSPYCLRYRNLLRKPDRFPN
ncbi:uncharacterized protein K02A2.6-like [Coccinella septempunctata]|uniref:uncharacterized protein K02A2.6-like n=1 Tax=Coccinella septempunctata TaxID=41139 RepID=UPI001D06A5FB|nr:uncharacterized protein K02A2.6-like [Coccinella septempunctata]